MLPTGCKIKWAASYSASFWAISHKTTAELASGEERSYFLKVYMHEEVKQMALGEFESTKAWYELTPDNVPEPIGTGECPNRPGKHSCLLEFRDTSDEMPAASDLVSILARVHQTSQSPTGKFGFHITTYSGGHPYQKDWCDT